MHRRTLLALLLVTPSLFACATPRGATGADPLPAGTPAPTFSLPTLEGTEVELANFQGKVVLLDFWASWCAPCKDAMPVYAHFAEDFGGEVVVVGVSTDEDPAALAASLDAHPVSFTVVHDQTGATAERYGVDTMPTSFIIGRDGTVLYRHRGFVPSDAEDLRARLKQAVEGSGA